MAIERDQMTLGTARVAAPRTAVRAEHAFLASVYAWMAAGLALTAVVALFTISTPALLQMVFGNRIVFFGLMIAEVGLVVGVSGAIQRITASTATALFLLYAALNGVTLSIVLLVYTGASVAGVFFVSAGMFGAMSVYGAVTRRDLATWGSFLFMGLIGVVLASLVNMFLRNDAMGFVLAMAGVVVFTGLAAYDTNKLRALGRQGFSDASAERKGAIVGALALYLDFINLFLMMLRLFGRRR